MYVTCQGCTSRVRNACHVSEKAHAHAQTRILLGSYGTKSHRDHNTANHIGITTLQTTSGRGTYLNGYDPSYALLDGFDLGSMLVETSVHQKCHIFLAIVESDGDVRAASHTRYERQTNIRRILPHTVRTSDKYKNNTVAHGTNVRQI